MSNRSDRDARSAASADRPDAASHGVDQRRIVAGQEAQRIPGFVVDTGAGERQLHVPGLRHRPAAAEPDPLGDLRLERTRPAIGPGLGRRAGEIDMDDRAFLRLAQLGSQLRQCPVDPGVGRRLVIEVAFDAVGYAHCPQGGEAFVEHPAGLAELRVGAVAECQHRIAHAVEARRVIGHQRRVEIDRALRRIALTPGAGNHQQVLRACDLGGRRIRHVKRSSGEAKLAGGLASGIGERLGIAGLGGEQNGQRCPARRRREGSGLRCRRCLVAGEEATQPGPLLCVGRRHDAVERGDLVGREGGAVWQHRQAWHGPLPQVLSLKPSRGEMPACSTSARCPATRRSGAAGRQPAQRRSASVHPVEGWRRPPSRARVS